MSHGTGGDWKTCSPYGIARGPYLGGALMHCGYRNFKGLQPNEVHEVATIRRYLLYIVFLQIHSLLDPVSAMGEFNFNTN